MVYSIKITVCQRQNHKKILSDMEDRKNKNEQVLTVKFGSVIPLIMVKNKNNSHSNQESLTRRQTIQYLMDNYKFYRCDRNIHKCNKKK